MKYKLCLLLPIMMLFISCREQVNRFSRPLLGTIINLTIISDESDAISAADEVFSEIERIEEAMSPYRDSSDVYRINRHAFRGPVPVSGETAALIRRSLDISAETGGAFDITFASLSGLWNFRKKPFVPPSAREVRARLHLVDYRRVVLDREKNTVRFASGGMKIGLGGIAKGYAVKRGIDILRKRGIRDAIVEEGGDLQVMGTKYGKRWVTGLRHPREESLVLALKLDDGDSIATSGDYERFAMYKGRRYHHIMDPRTGFPASGFSSVSVVSSDPVVSDSYATAIFVMGPERSREFLKKREDLKVILIDRNMNIFISQSLKKDVTLFTKREISWTGRDAEE